MEKTVQLDFSDGATMWTQYHDFAFQFDVLVNIELS